MDFKWITILFGYCFNAAYTLDFRYHNYSDLTNYLINFCDQHRQVNCSLKSIGKSLKGKKLWAIEIDAVNDSQKEVPNVKLIGNIHGNEPAGKEILLHLLEYLCDNYPAEPRVKQILENSKLYILPSLNPDGFEIANEGICGGDYGRNNGLRGLDLNRNFPDYFKNNKAPEQPETKAMKIWMKEKQFTLSASLHGGALVANYPFESTAKLKKMGQESKSPDDDVFRSLALTYSRYHAQMHLEPKCNNITFKDGITNGAAWYALTGGMQDYNYALAGCMELTLEISCCKYPYAKELPDLWRDNKDALIEYTLRAQEGVKGTVVDANTSVPIKGATLRIRDRNMIFNSSAEGEFWRILLPGKYELIVKSPSYATKRLKFDVKPNGTATSIKVNLYKVGTEHLDPDITTTTSFSLLKTTTRRPTTSISTDRSTDLINNEVPQSLVQQTRSYVSDAAGITTNVLFVLFKSFTCFFAFCRLWQ